MTDHVRKNFRLGPRLNATVDPLLGQDTLDPLQRACIQYVRRVTSQVTNDFEFPSTTLSMFLGW
jgi:hypothetical protein